MDNVFSGGRDKFQYESYLSRSVESVDGRGYAEKSSKLPSDKKF